MTNVTGLARPYLSTSVLAGGSGPWQPFLKQVCHPRPGLLAHSYLHTGVQAQWQTSLGLHTGIMKWCCMILKWLSRDSHFRICHWLCTLVPAYGRTSPVTNVTGLVRQYAGTSVQSQWQILKWLSRLVRRYERTKPMTNPKMTIASRTQVRGYKANDKS